MLIFTKLNWQSSELEYKEVKNIKEKKHLGSLKRNTEYLEELQSTAWWTKYILVW